MSLRTSPRRALPGALVLAAVAALMLSLAGPGLASTPPAQETATVTDTSCTPAPTVTTPGIVIAGVRVAKMGCALGRTVVVAYTNCRLANGPAGRCVKKVRGFACLEMRQTNPDGSFRARVTCTKAKKKVRHSYTQTAAA